MRQLLQSHQEKARKRGAGRGRHFMVGGSSPGVGNRASQLGGGGAGPQPAMGNRLFGPGVIGSDPTLGFDTDPAPAAGCGLPGARADEGSRYSAQGVSQVSSFDSAGHAHTGSVAGWQA